ncbi:MAG TPA: hypothetical protein DDZ80_20495 [Cyanobacteria bacterium UBA8803]|nr:hypothetical protein [Cyanobacteria bacterium UBA8803]
MPHFLLTWLLTALALMITAYFIPGISVTSFANAIVAVVVMGLVNAIVRPILVMLTLPLTILTLGLFLLVINAISLLLVAYLTPGFDVAGLGPALLGSIVLSLVSGILNKLFP